MTTPNQRARVSQPTATSTPIARRGTAARTSPGRLCQRALPRPVSAEVSALCRSGGRMVYTTPRAIPSKPSRRFAGRFTSYFPPALGFSLGVREQAGSPVQGRRRAPPGPETPCWGPRVVHDGKTSHLPPTATARIVPASHSRAQIWRGMRVVLLRFTASPAPAPWATATRTPDSSSSQAIP